ncbi:MAG TPA: hypothetical protein VFL79_12320, partial [Terriglobia bacterium]|nr:hypothetical protein [Terriglobia bacterium]
MPQIKEEMMHDQQLRFSFSNILAAIALTLVAVGIESAPLSAIPPEKHRPASVILISVDTLRAD